MALTREQILGVVDCATLEVRVPEWGDTVFVKRMTLQEFGRATAALDTDPDCKRAETAALLASILMCDRDGAPLMKVEDIQALTRKCTPAVNRVVVAGLRFKTMGENQLADVDELKKTNL
jgi:hypothetical protein